jgi:phospholipase/carboxylesterase
VELPRSQLVFTTVEAAEGPATQAVIALHGYGGQMTDLIPLARSLGPGVEIWIPRAPRPAYFGRDTIAHYWYVGERNGTPDPPSFGDCLFQVEQFVLDVVERRPELGRGPILLGVDQGAVLALAAAKVIPERLGGIVALAGYLPRIPGAPLPVDELEGLPILMINGPDGGSAGRLAQSSAARLERDGARVESHQVADPRQLDSPDMTRLVMAWYEAGSAATSPGSGRHNG